MQTSRRFLATLHFSGVRELLEDSVIKTRAEWDAFLKNSQADPLAPLSEEAKERFNENLTFCDNGLCGFDYGDLEESMTTVQYRNLMGPCALLGHRFTVGTCWTVPTRSGGMQVRRRARSRRSVSGWTMC